MVTCYTEKGKSHFEQIVLKKESLSVTNSIKTVTERAFGGK